MAEDIVPSTEVYSRLSMKPGSDEEVTSIWGKKAAANMGVNQWLSAYAPMSVFSAYTFGDAGGDSIIEASSSSAETFLSVTVPIHIIGSRQFVSAKIVNKFVLTSWDNGTITPFLHEASAGAWTDQSGLAGTLYTASDGVVGWRDTGTVAHGVSFGTTGDIRVGFRGGFSGGIPGSDSSLYAVQMFLFGTV